MTLQTVATARGRRTRQAACASTALPDLRPAQRDLLRRWLSSDAAERQWDSLLQKAGREQLDLADELLLALLNAGNLAVKERFVQAQWRIERVVWSNVPALQQALGLHCAEDRSTQRSLASEQLRELADQHPWAAPAVLACLQGKLPTATLQMRAALLQSLAGWKAEQRFGLMRDFALYARGHTKAVTAAEWDWLASHLPLDALGIARFAPVLWWGGALALHTSSGRLDAAAAGFCGIPMRALGEAIRVDAPRQYWLIENRASFERQALAASPGTGVVWLPGQPSTDWLQAVGRLLDMAPAPALISCDPDPAGIAIALTAGALWMEHGQAWSPHRMAQAHWMNAPGTPLNEFDRQLLDRLRMRADLPPEMHQLCDDLSQAGTKAEQEHWL